MILNLRITSSDAIRAGLSTHVCELQLLLRSFAAMVSPERHARYVRFRNDLPDRFQPLLSWHRIFSLAGSLWPSRNSSAPSKVNSGAPSKVDNSQSLHAPSLRGSAMSLQLGVSPSAKAESTNTDRAMEGDLNFGGNMFYDPSAICDWSERALFEEFFVQSTQTEAGSLQKRIAVTNSAMQHANSFRFCFSDTCFRGAVLAVAVRGGARMCVLTWRGCVGKRQCGLHLQGSRSGGQQGLPPFAVTAIP